MSDITKIKVDGESESSYKLFPKNREFEKRAGGNGGSQSGVQSDWNQNDKTAPDYIKNRPFYKELRSVTVENVSSDVLEGLPIFAIGDTVNVNVDGVEYSLVAYNDDGNVTIGDTWNDIDNGEGQLGWKLFLGADNTVWFYGREAHTVSFYLRDIVYHTIDPKYIRDMYYTSDPVETVLVEESTVSFSADDSGKYVAEFPLTFKATVGETYKVSWDGTTYQCTCVDLNDGDYAIGNLSINGSGPDTGEPFLMDVAIHVINVATLDGTPYHTISISRFVPGGVVKIDPKYLPKAAVITYDSNSNTYSSDLTNDELYESLLDGKQIVFCRTNQNGYDYLMSWAEGLKGRIDLTFAGNVYVSLIPDGTIIRTPDE